MSLLTSAVYPELERVMGPRERACSYTLSHTGAGWTLRMRHGAGSLSGWSTALASHGAGTDAPTRVAQAVGVRVLHELGVEVTGWTPGPGARTPDFLAETASAAPRRAWHGLHGH